MSKVIQQRDNETIAMPVVFCSKCGSCLVDVNSWINRGAIFECGNCGNKSLVSGFTIGRTRNGTAAQLAEARKDRAGLTHINPGVR